MSQLSPPVPGASVAFVTGRPALALGPEAPADGPTRAPAADMQGSAPSHSRAQGWILRGGLAFVFAYATVAMLVDPTKFTAYLPSFLPPALAERVFLPVFSVFEALLAVCLLAGRRLFAVSLLSAMTMAGIVVCNLDSFEVLFRNVAIACAALALALQAREARVTGAVPAAAG